MSVLTLDRYIRMRDALNQSGRAMFFALCGWHDWYAPPMPSLNYTGGYSLGNSARIANDDNSWAGVLTAADVMSRLAPYARPGYWNDPDLLLSVDIAGRLRMSELQSRAQFALWSVLSAPLIISGSIGAMSQYTLATYKNKAAIDINQGGGVQGHRLVGGDLVGCAGKSVTNCTNVWGKNTSAPSVYLSSSPSPPSRAVLLLNAGAVPAAIGCNRTCLAGLGLSETSLPIDVVEAWNHTTTTLTTLELPPVTLLPAGGHLLLTLTPKLK